MNLTEWKAKISLGLCWNLIIFSDFSFHESFFFLFFFGLNSFFFFLKKEKANVAMYYNFIVRWRNISSVKKYIHFILRKLTLKYSLETFSTLEYFEMKRTTENIRREIYMARSPRKICSNSTNLNNFILGGLIEFQSSGKNSSVSVRKLGN
mgnify:CR=1 FL=1